MHSGPLNIQYVSIYAAPCSTWGERECKWISTVIHPCFFFICNTCGWGSRIIAFHPTDNPARLNILWELYGVRGKVKVSGIYLLQSWTSAKNFTLIRPNSVTCRTYKNSATLQVNLHWLLLLLRFFCSAVPSLKQMNLLNHIFCISMSPVSDSDALAVLFSFFLPPSAHLIGPCFSF